MRRTTFQRVWIRVAEVAPVASLAAVLALPMILWQRPSATAEAARMQQAVAAAIRSAPYRVGAWAGKDVPVPESAVRLLRPNAVLSRRFVNLTTNESIDLIVVHCNDTRDMLGHYPPVCYPSHGWVFADGADQSRRGRAASLSALDRTWPVHVYEFSRIRDWSSEVRIQVISFFVLPDGTITNTIDEVNGRTSWMGSSVEGVAQIQFVASGEVPADRVASAASELLEGTSDLFSALGISDDR